MSEQFNLFEELDHYMSLAENSELIIDVESLDDSSNDSIENYINSVYL